MKMIRVKPRNIWSKLLKAGILLLVVICFLLESIVAVLGR